MANGSFQKVLSSLRSLCIGQAGEADSCAALLKRFVAHREEAAFSALFHRHAGMVLGVCRRVLHNFDDAEDARQATFLILARKASTIRKPQSLASWLYGTAYRVACHLRDSRAGNRSGQTISEPVSRSDPCKDAAWQEIQTGLDQELVRLPQRYREPLVLCYLEGKSREETARILSWTAGTLHGRLERARKILHARLLRRGLGLAAALVATEPALPAAAAAVKAAPATVKAALAFAAGEPVTGLVSAQVISLSNGVLGNMFKTKVIIAAAILLGIAAASAGAALLGSPGEVKQSELPQPIAKEVAKGKAQSGTDTSDKVLPAAINLKEIARWQALHVLRGHEQAVTHGAFARSGRLLATGDEGGGIILWEPAAGKQLAKLPAHHQPIRALGFAPDGKTLLSISADAVLKRWDVDKAKETRVMTLPIKGLQKAAFTPDGTTLTTTEAIVGSDRLELSGQIKVWDTSKGVRGKNLNAHSEFTKQMLFSSDGASLVTIGTGMRFQNQGGGVVGGSADSIAVWEFPGGKSPSSLPVSLVGLIGLSPDGKLAAVESMGGPGQFPIHIVDLAKGKETARLAGHAGIWGSSNSLDFSADGRVLASSSADKTVKLWDVKTAKELRTLRGHTSWVSCTLFAPHSDLLVSLGRDNTVRVWGSVPAGRPDAK
jgi:RNA polymerase sigma factor (sigma-70 family)